MRGAGFGFIGALRLVSFIFDRDFKIRCLDIDGFNGFTDDTSNGVKNLASGLELAFLKGLMEEFGTHVLEASEHIFTISLPVFINELFDFSPITPSGLNRALFFFGMIVNECSSGEAIELTAIEPSDAILLNLCGAFRVSHQIDLFYDINGIEVILARREGGRG